MGDSDAGVMAHAGLWGFGLRSMGHINIKKPGPKFDPGFLF